MARLLSLILVCLLVVPAVQAQEVHTFLGYSEEGPVVAQPSAGSDVDGWSDGFDNMLNARSKLELKDLAPPKGLSYVSNAYWTEIQQELKYLLDEQDSLFTGKAFGQGKTLYGVAMDGANRADSRWESFEFQVSQKTAEAVDKYKALKQSFTDLPTQSDERLSSFVEELKAIKQELAEKTKSLLAETGEGGTLANENFMQEFYNKYVSQESEEYLDPSMISSDPESEPLIGKTVRLTEKLPTINIDVNGYKKEFNAWKAGRRQNVSDLKERTKSDLYSSPYQKKLANTNNGPRLNTKYFINHVIRDESGKIVAVAVANRKGAVINHIIPYHGDTDGPTKRYFNRPIEHPLGKNFVSEDLGDKKVLEEWTKMLLDPLRDLEKLTSLHKVLGVEPNTSRSERVAACTESHAQQVLTKAEVFYRSMKGSRGKVLKAKFGLLKDLYEALINVEISLNSVLLHYGPNKERRQDRIALHLGSAQNYVATLIAMIGEKYRFDTESKTVFQDGVYATQRKSRIGNTYDYGTNNQDQVRAADYLMSGPYSLHDFVYLGNDRDVEVSVNYIGLQGTSDSNKTNKFTVAILDNNNEAYETLMTELSEVSRSSAGGTYRRPISECPTFKQNPNNLVMNSIEVDKAFITRNGSDSTVDVSFEHTGEKRGFTVYQETAGLKYAPWVDYDEVTTVVTAKNSRSDEQIDPDGFRIIVDASATMKGLFPKVVEGLKENLKQLDSEYLATEYTAFRPVHLFSSKESAHTKDSPYSLADFGNTSANGASWISESLRTLGNNIPEKPWILIILSDFVGDYFLPENWATATDLKTPATPREPARTLPPLFKESPSELWKEPGVKEYVINNSGKANEGWPRLTKVYCIAVQPLLTKMMPLKPQDYRKVLERRYPGKEDVIRRKYNERVQWYNHQKPRASKWNAMSATWMLSHVGGRNGIYVDLMEQYNPQRSMSMNAQPPEPSFQTSLQRAMDRIYRTHALNKKRGGSQ